MEASYQELVALYDSLPRVERLSRILLAESYFIQKEQREIDLVMKDATEQYALFQKAFPQLENRTPQYHISSYLGITPTQLSRIRAKR